jgi:hypothetical protein
MALYTDRAHWAVHTPVAGGAPDRRRLTQVGRALARLGIKHTLGYSPAARGRSERVNRTLQDRLVNELRLASITTVPAANRYLRERFLPAFNEEFGWPPADSTPGFIPLGPSISSTSSASRRNASSAATMWSPPIAWPCNWPSSPAAGLLGQLTASDRRDIGRIDLHGDRLSDQHHGQDNPKIAVPPEQSAVYSHQGASDHLDLHPLREERKWLVGEMAADKSMNGVDLGVWNSFGSTTWANQVHDPEGLEDPQPVRVAERREAVAGKQGDLDPLDSVLPPAPVLPERQKYLDPLPARELFADLLLVS